MNIRKLIHIAALLGALAISPVAWAAGTCTTNTGSVGMYMLEPFSTGDINPNAANNTVFLSKTFSMDWGPKFTVTCPDAGTTQQHFYEVTTGPSVGNNIYETSIPGIGIRLSWPVAGGAFPIGYQNNNPYVAIGPGQLKVEIIKIGPITQSGALTGEVGKGIITNAGNFQFASIRITGSVVISPKKPTCTVTTKSVAVNFPPVSQTVFTGAGSFSQEKPFSIDLNCAGGTNPATLDVAVTLTDQNDLANRSDTLSLTPTSTAKGVGLQILKGATVINYGPSSSTWGTQNQWLAGSAGNGTFSIPLAARYVQTGPTVTAGSANGQATFTMSYQ